MFEGVSQPFWLALAALFIGTGMGWIVQQTSAILFKNSEWPEVPVWKRRAISTSGMIAAFLAGTAVLETAPTFNPGDVVFRLWFFQVLAAWAGATFIERTLDRWRGKD